MERKQAVLRALILLVVASVLITAVGKIENSRTDNLEDQNSTTVRFASDGELKAEITAEIASTPGEREKGLMNRSLLPEDHGMLFVFPDEKKRVFWMKNTYIPLDIIFIAENKTIVDIDQADPEPDTPKENLTLYRSDKPAKYVIEVNQGFSKEKSIAEGDIIK